MFQVDRYNVTEPHLCWLVKEFEHFRIQNFDLLTEKFIPRFDVAIAFHFKSLPVVMDESPVTLKPFYVAPVNKKFLNIRLSGEIDSFVVLCKPTVLSRIFNVNLSEVCQHMVDVSSDIFHPLWQKISVLQTMQSRINCFSEFIAGIQQEPYIPDQTDILYDKILQKGISTPLKDIIESCCACERTLERNFLVRAGLSIKTLTRIVRFDYLWNKMKNENAVDYQDLVFYGKYFDQTHFIKDFKAITGETPHYFFNRNLRMVQALSGRG